MQKTKTKQNNHPPNTVRIVLPHVKCYTNIRFYSIMDSILWLTTLNRNCGTLLSQKWWHQSPCFSILCCHSIPRSNSLVSWFLITTVPLNKKMQKQYVQPHRSRDHKLSNLSRPSINLFLYIFAFAYPMGYVKKGQIKQETIGSLGNLPEMPADWVTCLPHWENREEYGLFMDVPPKQEGAQGTKNQTPEKASRPLRFKPKTENRGLETTGKDKTSISFKIGLTETLFRWIQFISSLKNHRS